MKIQTILRSTGPWLHLVVSPEADAEDLWRSWEQGSPRPVVRQVRGHKAQTAQALFDEFAAAWQFPSYFGENWDALEECLADLSWLPSETHLLGVRRAVHLLEKEGAGQRQTFWSVLDNVARGGGTPATGSHVRSGKLFRVVVQCLPVEEPRLRQALAEVGVAIAGRATPVNK